MRVSPLVYLAISLAAPWCTVPAQAQSSASTVNPDAVLAALKDLKAKQSALINKEKQQVMNTIAAAAADPAKAYEQAVVAVELQGQGNDGAKLIEWRKKQGDLLRNPAFINGLRLQLAYIQLSWQRSMGAKNKDLLPTLLDYTAQVSANLDTLWGYEALRRTLGDNVFVRYFQIGPYLASLENWSNEPFDTDSIYEKSILPTLREMKDPRVLDYWFAKVQADGARAAKGNNALAINKFNSVQRPALLWARAEDEETIGLHDQAVADMLALATAHPDHPDFDKWTARLTELVHPTKAEVIVHDGPSTTPAPFTSH